MDSGAEWGRRPLIMDKQDGQDEPKNRGSGAAPSLCGVRRPEVVYLLFAEGVFHHFTFLLCWTCLPIGYIMSIGQGTIVQAGQPERGVPMNERPEPRSDARNGAPCPPGGFPPGNSSPLRGKVHPLPGKVHLLRGKVGAICGDAGLLRVGRGPEMRAGTGLTARQKPRKQRATASFETRECEPPFIFPGKGVA